MDAIRLFGRKLTAPKRWKAGTHRAAPPAATLARARGLMKRVGITRLAELTGLDDVGIPVWTAVRPNGRALATSQGKGLDGVSAAVSALMESIETWHAEHLPPPERALAAVSARELGARAVDVTRLPSVRRPSRTAKLAWTRAWDLVGDREVLVPREAVTLDTVFPAGYQPVFDVSSNGLASGNHLLEAVSHGLCEVIERDAEARWRAARGDRRVALDSVRDPACRALLGKLAAAKLDVHVFDLTSDVGVPVYGAMLLVAAGEPAWRALGLYQGFGCHLDADVALARALTEAAQTRVTYIAGSRDDFFPFDYARATDEELLEGIRAELAAPPAAWVDQRRAPRLARATLEEDVGELVRRLVARGATEVLVADLGRGLGVEVVKTLVPGRATQVELMG